MQPKWLEWAQKLQAMSDDKLLLYERLRQRIYAQNGLTYSENPYDIERFKQVRAIAAEIMATYSNLVWTMDC